MDGKLQVGSDGRSFMEIDATPFRRGMPPMMAGFQCRPLLDPVRLRYEESPTIFDRTLPKENMMVITLHGHGYPVHIAAHKLRMWILSRYLMYSAMWENSIDRSTMEYVLDPDADLEDLFLAKVDGDFGGDSTAAIDDLNDWLNRMEEYLPPLPLAKEEHGGSD